MAVMGNRELGFDSGEGARETAATSNEGSRLANCIVLTLEVVMRWVGCGWGGEVVCSGWCGVCACCGCMCALKDD